METIKAWVKQAIEKPDKQGLGILIILALAVLFFSPLLFGGKVIFYRDFTFVTFPFRHFLAQTFQEGAIPFWNTNVYAGMPFMAGFHSGVFYPPSLLFFINDFPFALNLFYVLHFMILGAFTYLLARSWSLSFAAALCCGITGMLSGFMVASVLLSNFFLAAVWLPMIFWMFHQFRVRGHIGYFIGLIAAIASQTLAAAPEISILTMLLLWVHAFSFLPRAPGFPGLVRMTVPLALAVLLALGLSALQLLPTAKLMEHSFRDQGMSYETHVQNSLPLAKLSTLLLTPDYGGLLDTRDYPAWFSGFLHTLYMGVLSLALVLFGFVYRREKSVWFWLIVFVVGIVLSLGRYNPFYEWIYPWVPLLDLFRFPEKYFFISSFAAVFLSGYVLDAIIRDVQQRQFKWVSMTVLLILLIGGILVLSSRANLNAQLPLTVLLVFACILALFFFRKIDQRLFAGIVCLLVLMDLTAKDLRLLPMIDRKFYEEKPLVMDVVGDSFGKHRIYSGRIAKKPNPDMNPVAPTWMKELFLAKQYLRPFTGMTLGVEHVEGHPGLGLELRKHLIWFYTLMEASPEKRLRILKRSNVKYWIDWDSPSRLTDAGVPLVLPDRVKIWDDALPRAYMVGGVKQVDETKILDTYYDESFDPRAEILVSQPMDFESSRNFSGTVEEVTYRPNHVTVKTVQEGRGFLVLLDSYFPGWTVKVDGEAQPILRANHFYRAVQLDSGPHTLEFDYYPEGFKVGLVISSTVGVLLMLLLFWKRRRSVPSRGEQESVQDRA